MKETSTEVVIIGAGPAGLAAAATCSQAGIEYVLLEESNEFAKSWKNHYDRLCLHTAKSESYLPFKPFPKAWPEFVPRKDFVDYLEEYASDFSIEPQFNCSVRSVSSDKGRWMVQTQNEQWSCNQVIVATGFCRIPHRLKIPGLSESALEVIESGDYKNPEQPISLRVKKVLIVGMGNTGAEIALDLAENNVECAISVRGPVNRVRREIFGRPTQLSSIALSKLPQWMAFPMAKWVQQLSVPDLSEYGLALPGISPMQQLFEQGKTPVMDLGTGTMIRSGKIKIHPAIDRVEGNHIRFSDGSVRIFDAIVNATGYQNGLSSMIADWNPSMERDQPNLNWKYDELEGLYFIGFDARLNGQLRAIRLQAQWIASDIKSKSLSRQS